MTGKANDFIDLTGQQFGYWLVLSQAPRDGNKTMWNCRCVTCGYETVRRGTHLKNGQFAKCFGKHSERQGQGGSGSKPRGHANATEAYGVYRLRARKHGQDFTISREEFVATSQLDCHYCGAPPSQITNRQHFNGSFVYNGLDRKDSSQGYIPGNCLPCCGRCNAMKGDLPYNEFLCRAATIVQRALDRDPTSLIYARVVSSWPPKARWARPAAPPG